MNTSDVLDSPMSKPVMMPLGTTAGIALQQTALQRLPGGMAVSLLATAPLMALPLARLEGDSPGWRGLLAALLALGGLTALVA